MATSSIGKTVRLNNATGKKMVRIMAHPSKVSKSSGTIHTGRIQTHKRSK